MKKIIFAFFILVLYLSGCGKISEEGKSNPLLNTSDVINMGMINFKEIELAGIDWDKIEFPIDTKEIEIPADTKSISTKEDAIKIGKTIIENCWNNNKFLDFVLLTVVHSTEDNIWRFDYSIDQRDKTDGTYLLCGGFYVAIDGSNGEVIKAWVDE